VYLVCLHTYIMAAVAASAGRVWVLQQHRRVQARPTLMTMFRFPLEAYSIKMLSLLSLSDGGATQSQEWPVHRLNAGPLPPTYEAVIVLDDVRVVQLGQHAGLQKRRSSGVRLSGLVRHTTIDLVNCLLPVHPLHVVQAHLLQRKHDAIGCEQVQSWVGKCGQQQAAPLVPRRTAL
jgi:hypothetical protein